MIIWKKNVKNSFPDTCYVCLLGCVEGCSLKFSQMGPLFYERTPLTVEIQETVKVSLMYSKYCTQGQNAFERPPPIGAKKLWTHSSQMYTIYHRKCHQILCISIVCVWSFGSCQGFNYVGRWPTSPSGALKFHPLLTLILNLNTQHSTVLIAKSMKNQYQKKIGYFT